MAAPWRVFGSAALKNGRSLFAKPAGPLLQRYQAISTSKKNRETAATLVDPVTRKEVGAKTEAATAPAKKNWVSYGFHYDDETADVNAMHATLFTSVTLCLVVVGYVWAYRPDFGLTDWAQREAYLELRRRESLGLPHIDPNLIDPANIELPSDEELGDMDIVI